MIDETGHVKIGEIGKPHHLQGAVVVHAKGDLLSLQPNEPVFILLEGAPVPFYIARGGISRKNASSYIVKFDYVDSAARAGRLSGHALLGTRELAGEEEEAEEETLPPELAGLVGYTVLDLLTGEAGEVVDVANYSGNVVLSVRVFSREILLPLSGDHVKEILPGERLLRVEIPEELKELNG
jgi:16S rRNA processing protein RimM